MPGRRKLFWPADPEQRIEGNCQSYFLPLMNPEGLNARARAKKTTRLLIQTHSGLVLSNEWQDGLLCE